MAEIKLDLRERSPALAEALTFLRDESRRVSGPQIADDFQDFLNVCDCDLYLEMATAYGKPSDEASLLMIGHLTNLEDIATRFPNIKKSLRDYLPRLEEFAKRDNSLQDLYFVYEEAFGGKTQ